MALTVSLTGDWLGSQGNKRTSHGTITFDNSYAAGGEALTPANIGLGAIDRIQFNDADGYTFEYDYTNEKVKVYVGGGQVAAHTHDLRIIGGQAVAGTDIVQGAVGDLILGKQEATDALIAGADEATKGGVVANTAVAGAAGSEVAATTDLSSVSVEFWAVGR